MAALPSGLCALLAALILPACSVTAPVAVIGANGEIMRGTTTADLFGGTFEASNARATCKGTYDANPSDNVSFAVVCTDGRRGIGTAKRETASTGSGEITMTDGTKARFVYGETARNL